MSHHTKPIVLIVEDEAHIAQVLSFIIEDAGYLPLIAHNGEHALEMVKHDMPDLIITDFMMPHMNGAEFIAALRARESEHGMLTHIIIMSAAGKQYIDAAGADAFLAKPFEIPQVEAMLSQFLAPVG